jgi:hypothetical protein
VNTRHSARTDMNKAESDRIHELCSLIAVEQDRAKFIDLVEELNHILEAKGERLLDRTSNAEKNA